MEIGLYTFGDLPVGTRGPEASRRRLLEIVETATLADQAGLCVFGVGEHHRPDYTISVPVAVMGAIAAVTKNIRITTAVTILSSSDPVRIFEELGTIDLLSGGRGELTVGRGAFIESSMPVHRCPPSKPSPLRRRLCRTSTASNRSSVLGTAGRARRSHRPAVGQSEVGHRRDLGRGRRRDDGPQLMHCRQALSAGLRLNLVSTGRWWLIARHGTTPPRQDDHC